MVRRLLWTSIRTLCHSSNDIDECVYRWHLVLVRIIYFSWERVVPSILCSDLWSKLDVLGKSSLITIKKGPDNPFQMSQHSTIVDITMTSWWTRWRLKTASALFTKSPAPLAFVRGVHRYSVKSPHKWQVTRKKFPFENVIIQAKSWAAEISLVHPSSTDEAYIFYESKKGPGPRLNIYQVLPVMRFPLQR